MCYSINKNRGLLRVKSRGWRDAQKLGALTAFTKDPGLVPSTHVVAL